MIAGPVCIALASKVLKQRPGTVQRAKDVYLMFCELEQAETVVVRLAALHAHCGDSVRCFLALQGRYFVHDDTELT